MIVLSPQHAYGSMEGYFSQMPVFSGHLSISNIDFRCPHCGKKYSDENDKYLDRCNKNKDFCTSIKCECGEKFKMTYNTKGDAVSF